MTDHPNTEATPSEVEAAAKVIADQVCAGQPVNVPNMDVATAALNAAYAIRLPPLYDKLEQAERRNLLNPSATEYVEQLEAELERLRDVVKAGETCRFQLLALVENQIGPLDAFTKQLMRAAIENFDNARQALQEQP